MREGQNPNIDDDTRARAMAWVKAQQEKAEGKAAPAPKVEVKPAPKAKAKAAPAVTDEDLAGYEKAKNYQRAQEYAKTPAAKAEREEKIKGQALVRDTTMEENLLGGAALRPLSRLAKSLAGAKSAAPAAKTGTAVAERLDKITPIPNRPRPVAPEALPGSRRAATALPNKPTPALPGPKALNAPAKAADPARLTKSDTVEQGATWTSPAKATEKIGKARGVGKTKPVPPKTSKKPAAKRTRKFNDDEAGTEFAKGGRVGRGWGIARKC